MRQNKELKRSEKDEEKIFIETARRFIRENPEFFEALMEFERTKKLPKLSRKERINITIDTDLLRKFRRYCKAKGYAMSTLLERHIKEELGLKRAGLD